jgi:hypothetical protein
VFLNSPATLIIIAVQFVVGALLGLAVAALIRRFRLGRWRALVTAVSAGTAFECAIGLAGWMTWSSTISAKYPGIANLLDNYAIPFAVLCCLSVATLISLAPPKRKGPAQR